MICLGRAQRPPTRLDAEASQLYIVQWFRTDFLRRYPSGIVISEYEYMGRTTASSGRPTPLRTFGQPNLNRILDALSHDFRRWVRERDYRKCDVLGIANDGMNAELLEVTTEGNAASAVAQLNSKLNILRLTVNRIHQMSVDWRTATWRPAPHQMFAPLRTTAQLSEWICYTPTFRVAAPPGVILYEIHTLARDREPVPIHLPKEQEKKVREAVEVSPPRSPNVEVWARNFLRDHPDVSQAIRAMALVAAVTAVLAAIVLLFDPVPGDEVASFAAAMALFRFATGR